MAWRKQVIRFQKDLAINMSTSGEDVQILEARIKELVERLRTSDEKLKASQEQELRISEEKIKVLHNKIKQLNKHIDELESELDICLLTSKQMPVEWSQMYASYSEADSLKTVPAIELNRNTAGQLCSYASSLTWSLCGWSRWARRKAPRVCPVRVQASMIPQSQ
jgi:hypothetical protein